MSDPVKVQINSVEALERLLGSDPELEFEIRRSVVENFAKNRVIKLVNESATLESVALDVKRELNKRAQELIPETVGAFKQNSYSQWDRTFVLSKEMLERLKSEVRQVADDAYRVAMNEYVVSRVKEIEERVWRRMEDQIVVNISKDYERRVKEEVDRRINNLKSQL